MKACTICVANHKGGVGKTTTAVNLATGLAGLGYPTMLIDCDSQGNVAQFLNLDPSPGLYELIIMEWDPARIVRTVPGYSQLGVIPSNELTLDIEISLNAGRRLRTDTAISNALKPFRNGHQKPFITILDTAPSLSSLQVSALNASDWLIIPARPEYASETGIKALTKAVTDLREVGSNLQLLGILPTMVDNRTTEHRATISQLQQAFPDLVLPTVRNLIAIAEAPGFGVPIWDHDQNAARDYAAVLGEVVQRLGI